MPSKQRVLEDIDKIDKPSVSVAMLRHFVTSVTMEIEPPKYYKKGDVIQFEAGLKPRPCVIVKLEEEIVYAIPLSSTCDEINLCESRSRFFGRGFFSKTIVAIKTKYCNEHYLGIYDNPKLLNKAIKLLKQEINNI